MWNLTKRNQIFPAFVFLLMACALQKPAKADTTATIWLINSGPAITSLQVTDDVCSKTRVDQYFAANDGKKVDGFCVRDASQVKTDLSIFVDGNPNPKYQLQDIPTDSSVDVVTGNVTPH